MKSYNSYHTCIKQLARSNMLPNKYVDSIDRSTIWRWKQEKGNKYLGHELSNVQALQQFLERRESETLIRTYLKTTLALSSIFKKTKQLQSILSQNKDLFVGTLIRYKNSIRISFILRVLNLSPSVFYHWKNQVLYPCKSSALKLCIKRPPIPKKARYKTGIRATQPHQIWHADITVVKCLNGMKYYVYLLMDNYSRFILNYQVSTKVSASIRLDSIRDAYREYIIEPVNDTLLLVDGGFENNNHMVDQYLNSKNRNLRKLIAGKDIRFSNSMVEAQNKLIKYYYLLKHAFQDLKELEKMLDWIIQDYNHIIPHHSLEGLTPLEALNGNTLPCEQWKIQMRQAREIRIKENTSQSCGIC